MWLACFRPGEEGTSCSRQRTRTERSPGKEVLVNCWRDAPCVVLVDELLPTSQFPRNRFASVTGSIDTNSVSYSLTKRQLVIQRDRWRHFLFKIESGASEGVNPQKNEKDVRGAGVVKTGRGREERSRSCEVVLFDSVRNPSRDGRADGRFAEMLRGEGGKDALRTRKSAFTTTDDAKPIRFTRRCSIVCTRTGRREGSSEIPWRVETACQGIYRVMERQQQLTIDFRQLAALDVIHATNWSITCPTVGRGLGKGHVW